MPVFFENNSKNTLKNYLRMNIKQPSEGEVLRLILRRSGKRNGEIAKMLEIHPNHLSKLFKSEKLTRKIKERVSAAFGFDISVFSGPDLASLPNPSILYEPDVEYRKMDFEDLSAAEIMRYLEDKDRRHHEERIRLLGIIENLTKK